MKYSVRKMGALLLCAVLLLSAVACKPDRERAERTAIVNLSDTGIEISGSGCEVEDNRLKIKEAGVYEISGTLSNGSIYVNADKESEVHLIFNGVTVHNETSAAVYCKKAAKVTITLAEGSVNTLSDGTTYVFEEGEDEPDATLYAKSDLVISGAGKLAVTSGYKDAIKGKDSLYIFGGEYAVKSAEDGIVGRDLLYIADGTFTVDAVGDALKASNDADEGLGNVVVDGGNFTLTAGDDGIHAEESLQIEGDSKIRITKSYEGLEALNITIAGGEIDITASDDGLNAAGGADGSGFGHPGMGMFGEGEGEVTISGGTITVNAGGDGLDSNGNLTINEGTITVFGPTGGGNGVLDYGGSFMMNGGTLLAVGSSDMAQTPSDASGQYSLAAVLEERAKEGSTVEVAVNGKSVLLQEIPKRFNYIVASSKEFVKDADVSIAVNGEICYEGTLTDTVTCFGVTGGMGGFGGPGGFGGGGKGDKGESGGRGDKGGFGEGERPQMPNGEMPQMPEGEWPDFSGGERPQLPEGGWPAFPWNKEQSEMSD